MRKYFVKDYTIGEMTPFGKNSPLFLNLIPELGITMKPLTDTPTLKINAWYYKSRRKKFYHIRCEILREANND